MTPVTFAGMTGHDAGIGGHVRPEYPEGQVLSAGRLVFAQLCGSNSPRRLLGQVGSFVSTSLR
jgi:hypothetical protein